MTWTQATHRNINAPRAYGVAVRFQAAFAANLCVLPVYKRKTEDAS